MSLRVEVPNFAASLGHIEHRIVYDHAETTNLWSRVAKAHTGLFCVPPQHIIVHEVKVTSQVSHLPGAAMEFISFICLRKVLL